MASLKNSLFSLIVVYRITRIQKDMGDQIERTP